MKKKIRNFLKGRMQSHVVKGSKEIKQRSCNDLTPSSRNSFYQLEEDAICNIQISFTFAFGQYIQKD
jgi:hypothetical protein